MKKVAITLSIVVVAIVAWIIFMPHTSSPATTPVTESPTSTTNYYTKAEVATHASSQSCWSIVNGKVYDLTSWIGQHPGGQQAIKGLCGTDGSATFNGQHGGQPRPERELAGFIIGELK